MLLFLVIPLSFRRKGKDTEFFFFTSYFVFKGIAGLAVTYGLNLNMLQAWVIWSLCNLENKIISVERILQYTSIPSEPPLVVESNQPDHSWPSHGEVEIRDLQVLSIVICLAVPTYFCTARRVLHMYGLLSNYLYN